MPNRVAAAHIWLFVVALVGYGTWGLIHSWHVHSWVTAIGSCASIAAAVGVALRKRWSRPLVFLLAALFVGTWLLSVWFVSSGGYYRGCAVRDVVILVLPGLLLSGIAIFCCYVVAVRLRSSQGQT
jgi:hypothetical protein